MSGPFNQGAPVIPTVLNTSNCFIFSNSSTGNALSVQQLGAGNVFVTSNANGTIGLFVSATSNVGIGTTNPRTALDVYTGTMNTASVIASTAYNTSGSGVYQVAGTTVVDASRNLTNIGTVSGTTLTASTAYNTSGTGVYQVTGTTVIDASRNLTNIGTVGSGAITSTSTVSGTTLTASTAYNTSGAGVYQVAGTTVIDASRNLTNIGTVGSGAITSTSTVSGTTLTASTAMNTSGAGVYQVAGTTVIDASRNLTNIGTVGSGAITSTSTVSGTTLTASTAHNTSGTGVYQVAGTTVIDASRNMTGVLGTFSGTPAAAANVLTVIGSSTTGNVVQFSNSAGGTFILTNAGRVGIGTTNPGGALAVNSTVGQGSTPILTLTDSGTKSLSVVVNAGAGNYNQAVAAGDTLLVSGTPAGGVDLSSVVLGPFSSSALGMRIACSSNVLGLYSNATTFYSNAAATVMTLTNGRVGIGSASPGYILDIGGFASSAQTLRIGATSSNACVRIMEATDAYGFSMENIATAVAGASGARMDIVRHSGSVQGTPIMSFLRDNPYVGIGITNPQQYFHVSSGTIGGVPTTAGTGSDSNVMVRYTWNSIVLDHGCTNTGTVWMQSRQPTTSLGTTFPLALNPIGGNVGIGTTSPGYILEVSNSTASTSTSFLGLTNPYVFGFNTGLNIGSSIVYSSRWQGDGGSGVVEMCKIDGRKENSANYGDSYLAFQTRYETNRGAGGAGTLSEKMRITGSGNVGIGTDGPAAKLAVVVGGSATQAGPAWDSSWFTVGTAGNSIANAVGLGWNTASNYGVLSCSQPTVAWRPMLYTASVHDFYIAGSFVASIRNALTGGATTLSVDANGYIIRTPSDQRLKTDIQPISYGLETVNAFRAVSYNWNEPEKYGTGRSIGLIAQEVAELVPEAVSACTDENKTLSLDYQKLVPVLTKAIQELSAQNKTLEARLAALEAKLNSQ